MHIAEDVFLKGISGFLGSYFLLVALMNGVAAFLMWNSGKDRRFWTMPILNIPFSGAGIWLGLSFLCLLMAAVGFSGNPWWMGWVTLPQFIRGAVDYAMGPTVYSVGSFVLFLAAFFLRRYLVPPMVAFGILNASLILMGMSMTDPDFASIMTKADNVPIVAMIYLLGFFTWLATYRAVQNDDRMKRGEVPLEKLDDEKVLVWPDLVYTEMICMVALTALMLIWAIGLQAPLEEPASAVKTPNPSKAPWYFLGLQEMLVYYDPWMAGVVLPSMVVAGLMAIPYIDFNRKGNGYYTIEQRQFAYLMFQFGFIVLWVTLIVMGTFLRGPNWNFFGPYETWDVHKVEALNNIDLSTYFWVDLLRSHRPFPPDGSSEIQKFGYILLRELPGIVLTIGYLLILPPALVLMSSFVRDMFIKMGFIRYMVLCNLFLMMMLLPIKMVFRWTFNLKYFIALPEYMMNF